MNNEKHIVITAYGHDNTVDKIAVSAFDGGAWVYARSIAQDTPCPLDDFVPPDMESQRKSPAVISRTKQTGPGANGEKREKRKMPDGYALKPDELLSTRARIDELGRLFLSTRARISEIEQKALKRLAEINEKKKGGKERDTQNGAGNGEYRIVITARGQGQTVYSIEAGFFAGGPDWYCGILNNFLPEFNDRWTTAKIANEYTPCPVSAFAPLSLSDAILALDDFALQAMLRDAEARDIDRALRGAAENVKEKIFRNMPDRAVLKEHKEDMEYTGPVDADMVQKSRAALAVILNRLEQTGSIKLNGVVSAKE